MPPEWPHRYPPCLVMKRTTPSIARTSAGYTAVILSAYDSRPEALNYLLRIGADPCLGDRHGNTSLMGAIYKGHMAIARRLLATRLPYRPGQ